MKWLIIMDIFSLDRWLLHDEEPDIMPAVTNLLNYLGTHSDHHFTAICVHPQGPRTKTFANGSEIRIIKSSVKSLYARKLVAQQQLFKIGLEVAKTQSYDVVYGLSIYALVARRIGKKLGIRSVGRLFGSLVWDVVQQRQWAKLYTRHILQYLEIKYPCDITIATEDGTEIDKAFAKTNPNYRQLNLLYNGINQSLREQLLALPLPSLDTNQPIRLLSMARLTQWKRHDLAIQLVSALKKNSSLDIRLTIVGKGEQENDLTQMVKEKGLEEVVIFRKPVPRSKLATLIGLHDVAVVLYDASNLGNVMWECSLAGRLIVTRPTGKTASVYNDSNAIVWGDDAIEHLSEEIIRTLDQGKALQRRTEQVRADINHLLPSWQERIEEEIRVITEAFSAS